MERGGRVEIVILAAGESSRFQGVKALAPVDNMPMLQRAIDNFQDIAGTSLSVVLGGHLQAIESAITFVNARKIINPDWQQGIASSIRCAINNVATHSQAILFVAGDQVRVERAHLIAMIQQWRGDPDNIVAAGYENQPGIPAIFPRRFWPLLSALSGDKGAKVILLKQQNTILFPLPQARIDIDTRQDLDNLV